MSDRRNDEVYADRPYRPGPPHRQHQPVPSHHILPDSVEDWQAALEAAVAGAKAATAGQAPLHDGRWPGGA